MDKKSLNTARRILIIDDNSAIHADFKKILMPSTLASQELKDAAQALFGDPGDPPRLHIEYEVDVALSGQEGLEKVMRSLEQGRSYLLAFVDMKMPNGWNGIETTRKIWEHHPELQIVICTAFSDLSWDEIKRGLADSDRFLILKKPFDNIEVQQMAQALSSRAIAEKQLIETQAIRLEAQQIAKIGNYYFHVQDEHWGNSDLLDEIFGLLPDTIRDVHHWISLVDAPYQEALSRAVYETSHVNNKFEQICRITRVSDQQKRWVSIRGRWAFSADGNPLVLKGTVRTIPSNLRGWNYFDCLRHPLGRSMMR